MMYHIQKFMQYLIKMVIVFIVFCLVYLLVLLVLRSPPHEIISRWLRMEGELNYLQAHRSIWQSKGPDKYQIHVLNRGYSQFSFVCDEADIQVNGEEIVNANELLEIAWFCPDDLKDFTIESLFALLEKGLRDPLRYDVLVKYNNQMGYIEFLHVVVTPTIFDSVLAPIKPKVYTIEVHDFEVVD